ncbi:hypothetical protein KW799_00565, partial [Candidatus Parcubacteria bacterium]|nr:hypothetical protein [Candidatus Parcubacteria bacterium]
MDENKPKTTESAPHHAFSGRSAGSRPGGDRMRPPGRGKRMPRRGPPRRFGSAGPGPRSHVP